MANITLTTIVLLTLQKNHSYIYFPKRSRIFSKIVLMEIIVFIHKGCIKLIKSDSKDIYTCSVSTKIWRSTTVFNIDNNPIFFWASD